MDHLVLFSFTFSVLMCFVNAQDPRVTSKLGDIIGKTRNLTLDISRFPTVHEYLGIPFAQPPVGDRRFRKPEPRTSLDSPFYAQNHRAICPQFSNFGQGTTSEQSEDCLFLNVYVPDQHPELPYGHAVMIWVYGGGFQQGAASFYDGAFMSAAGNVIVVTFNYRVGVFGFLSTGDENAPGNFGLWDQRLAFQWVHDYIGDFGGDKNRVTIAGQSAGAMSVIQHALVPDNNGLFQRVLAQSGTMSMPGFDFERDGMKDVLVLADQLGCPDTTDELMYCLREKSVDEYNTALKNIQTMGFNFKPIMDGELMKINPQHISKMSKEQNLNEVEFFRSLDILTGFNSYDGAFSLPFIMDPTRIETIQPTRDDFSDIYLPNMLKMLFRNGLREELMELVEAQYTNWTDLYGYDTIRLHITKLAGDTNFAIPAIDIARLHKNSYSANSTFMYHFTPAPSVRTLPTPSWIPGANHGDELPFMFGRKDVIGVGEENAWEVELSAKMVTYWSNFIKSGNPNFPDPVSPYWSEYNDYADRYMVLEKHMTGESEKKFFFAEEANFWLHVFPDLAGAVEDKESGRWCGDVSAAAAAAAENLNSKTFVLVIITLFSIYVF